MRYFPVSLSIATCLVAIAACAPGEASDDPVGAAQSSDEAPASDGHLDPATTSLDTLTAQIAAQHPSAYYILATRLFEAGERDEAVFWFYVGQLRYRIHLACDPENLEDGEAAAFGALQSNVGETINGYAGADPEAWADAMQRALDWDAATANGFEAKDRCPATVADQRAGLSELRDRVRSSADEIRATRAENGLPNSGE